jgi:UDP-glucose 4-epimerase
MKAILVTGATTPVGVELVERLLRKRHDTAVLAIGAEASPTVLPLDHPRLVYRQIDLTRERNIRRLMFGEATDMNVKVIIHGALHRSAHDTGRHVHRLNVETTRALLRLAERHSTIERFVYRSYAEVYRIEHDQPDLLGEDHPLDFRTNAPQRVRDRIEADLTVCTHVGMSPLHIVVLRCAEILAPDMGSQLYDYLQSRVCFRPLGFDPMVNLLSIRDAVRAIDFATSTDATGIFNVPGMDTMPLSSIAGKWHRLDVPVFGPLMRPLYYLRHRAVGRDFNYDLSRRRFHFSGILDGTRAELELDYLPKCAIEWPRRAA